MPHRSVSYILCSVFFLSLFHIPFKKNNLRLAMKIFHFFSKNFKISILLCAAPIALIYRRAKQAPKSRISGFPIVNPAEVV